MLMVEEMGMEGREKGERRVSTGCRGRETWYMTGRGRGKWYKLLYVSARSR